MSSPRHFLVVAAASQGGRLFVKKALNQGHDVTALCRATDDQGALDRITRLISDATLTPGGVPVAEVKGRLQAYHSNILDPNTYITLLNGDTSIDGVCCFVGVTKIKEMFSKEHQLYTHTVGAIVEGMRQSRWVELFYHGSSGSEGPPGQNIAKLPENYTPKWLITPFLHMPAVKNYLESESILAQAIAEGLLFVIFRPAFLTNGPAKRKYGYSFDTTGMDKEELPLRNTTMSISREDVSEEILRVATLRGKDRKQWFSHGVYLADFKKNIAEN
jgi:nucleoside-diphosphate-sugar epimerase